MTPPPSSPARAPRDGQGTGTISSIHAAAQAYDGAVAVYLRGRPPYPAAAVDRLAVEIGLTATSTVVEVAAGTGRLTTHLVERVGAVVAVEPVEGFRKALADAVDGVDVRAGTAENIPVDDGSADVVVVGQAFHWFDGPAALAEIDRVLRPGGSIGLIWNVRSMADPAHRAASTILAPLRPTAPTYASMEWRKTFENSTRWQPLAEADFGWTHEVDVDRFCDRFLSVSIVAALPADQQTVIADRLAAAFRETTDGDIHELAYTTRLYWTARS